MEPYPHLSTEEALLESEEALLALEKALPGQINSYVQNNTPKIQQVLQSHIENPKGHGQATRNSIFQTILFAEEVNINPQKGEYHITWGRSTEGLENTDLLPMSIKIGKFPIKQIGGEIYEIVLQHDGGFIRGDSLTFPKEVLLGDLESDQIDPRTVGGNIQKIVDDYTHISGENLTFPLDTKIGDTLDVSTVQGNITHVDFKNEIIRGKKLVFPSNIKVGNDLNISEIEGNITHVDLKTGRIEGEALVFPPKTMLNIKGTNIDVSTVQGNITCLDQKYGNIQGGSYGDNLTFPQGTIIKGFDISQLGVIAGINAGGGETPLLSVAGQSTLTEDITAQIEAAGITWG